MRVIFIAFTFLLISTCGFSQLTKSEKKKWKKEMKMFGVEGYKKMSQQNTRLLLENRALKQNLDASEKKALAQLAELEKIRKEKDSIYTAVAQNIKKNKDVPKSVSERSAAKGAAFKVQIGAYNDFDLSQYFDNHKNFGIEEDENGTLKYTLGIFKNYNDAVIFRDLMREMGVKGAWVVSYKQNSRIDIKEAF